ncbi:MAG: ATP-binding protein [Flavobacteriaceae bacterium]|nr:ATP-binding protein [Flavobacteriaceae bacterium]
MAGNFKNANPFALKYAFYISLTATAVLLLIFFFAGLRLYWILALFFLILFAIAFLSLRAGVENYVLRLIKNVYKEVSLLEGIRFTGNSVSNDLESLTSDIEKFARGKKIEIETLKIREEYRKDFLGNVAHEMKTPLFTIQGYILTLLDGAMEDKKIRKKYLDRANKAVQRLLYIVKDLDTITKLESGTQQVSKHPIDIIALIRSVFEMLEMKAEKKNISLIFDRPYLKEITVLADHEKIEQVLINLIENSIKYGHTNGTTEVSVEDLVKDKVIVRVTDNGDGISREHLPRLFERFYRVDKSGSRKEGGSGLGLSIVKHIVEAHGERIYVESEPDVGSEFSFTLQKIENTESKSTSELN